MHAKFPSGMPGTNIKGFCAGQHQAGSGRLPGRVQAAGKQKCSSHLGSRATRLRCAFHTGAAAAAAALRLDICVLLSIGTTRRAWTSSSSSLAMTPGSSRSSWDSSPRCMPAACGQHGQRRCRIACRSPCHQRSIRYLHVCPGRMNADLSLAKEHAAQVGAPDLSHRWRPATRRRCRALWSRSAACWRSRLQRWTPLPASPWCAQLHFLVCSRARMGCSIVPPWPTCASLGRLCTRPTQAWTVLHSCAI